MPSPAGVHEARPSPLPAASLLPLHTSQVYLLLIFKFCAARLRSCCCACSCDHEEVPTGSVLTAALPSAPGAKAQEPRGIITRAEGAGACAGPSGRMHLPSFRVGGTAPRACTSQPPGLRSTHPGAPVASPPADRMSLRDSPGGPGDSAAPWSGSRAPGELGEGPAAPDGARLGGPARATGARTRHHGSGWGPGLRPSPLCFTFLVGTAGTVYLPRALCGCQEETAPPGGVSGLPGRPQAPRS